MGVVSRSAWTFLGVLLLTVLGSSVLEPDGDPGLLQIQFQCDGLSHEDVRIVAGLEDSLQLLQLPLAEVCPRTSSFVILALRICNR